MLHCNMQNKNLYSLWNKNNLTSVIYAEICTQYMIKYLDISKEQKENVKLINVQGCYNSVRKLIKITTWTRIFTEKKYKW